MALFATLFLAFLILQKVPVINHILMILIIVMAVSFFVAVGVRYFEIDAEQQKMEQVK